MSTGRLLLQSLLYYWRTNLAVLLGVVAATAVIGGALIVGDSVRGSLETMSRDRLGRIDYALSSHRFLQESLADRLAARLDVSDLNAGGKAKITVAPALVMIGAVERELTDTNEAGSAAIAFARAGQVNVYGLDERLWDLTEHGEVALPKENQIIVSQRLAEQLQQTAAGVSQPLEVGDEVTVWIELPASIPRDTLLGDREQQSSVSLTLEVSHVLPARSGVGRLELNPSQQLPLNAFVSLDTLQQALGLAAKREPDPIARRIINVPARVNALFVGTHNPAQAEERSALEINETLNDQLKQSLELADLSLRVVTHEAQGYLSLESQQQILTNEFAEAANQLDQPTSPTLVYIANEIANADQNQVRYKTADQPGQGYSMYSLVAGIEQLGEPGFPQFEFVGDPPTSALGEDEILINEWLAKDLAVKVGDQVRLKYYQVGAHVLGEQGGIPEESVTFTVRGLVKLTKAAIDKGWVPEVKGITDARTFSDIKEPFPMKRNLITDRDEEYWETEEYRATPKAFISLKTAQSLWQSRYGQLTSMRIAMDDAANPEAARAKFTTAFLEALDPSLVGVAFRPVKYLGLQAARGTTDFSGLFIGFSFFLILSATILIGLLFRLGIEQRTRHVGLLAAVGFTPGQVRLQFLIEGALVVLVGGLLGVAAAIGYAHLMVYGLKTWWIGAIGTRFLEVYVEPLSLVTGFAISVAITLLTIWWALRQLKRLSTRDLLSGVTETTKQQHRRGGWAWKLAIGCGLLSLVILIAALARIIPAGEAFMGISWQVVGFFVVGVAMLTASLAWLAWWLDSDKGFAVRGSGWMGTSRLGMRNAARNRMRSTLTVGLIASATFVIVAVAAGHRNPAVESPELHSGNGGYSLVAESSTPLHYDLNTQAGRAELGFSGPAPADALASEPTASGRLGLLQSMLVTAFRVKPGENASCLNLYQTQLPTVLGVSENQIERGGFKFVGADRENPWTLLNEPLDPVTVTLPNGEERTVPAYPVLGDVNTLQYSLHKAPGDIVPVPNPDSPEFALQIMGQLDGSVFQGVLLLSETHFEALFPEQSGYQYFLIEAPPETAGELSNLLETELHDYGFDAEPVGRRLESFLEVQNTYLSTFQALGGLGLLLGTLGLATVMLRNVLERRSELALLRSVGFLNSRLVWLVLCENVFLLAWGLLAGTVSALAAMAPHLVSIGADVPWAGVTGILAVVILAGMLAAFAAVLAALRTPVLATLRAE